MNPYINNPYIAPGADADYEYHQQPSPVPSPPLSSPRSSPNMNINSISHPALSPRSPPLPFATHPSLTHSRHDLFFSNPPPARRPSEPPIPSSSAAHVHHHPKHAHSVPEPHESYARGNSSRTPNTNDTNIPVAAALQAPESPTEDDKELQMVLELSKSETNKQQEYFDEMTNREEEELARALEASMKLSANSFVSGTTQAYNAEPSSSKMSEPSSKPDTPSAVHRGDSWASTASTQMSEDEALARRLAEEEEAADDLHRRNSASGQVSLGDEALARKLAEEEEEEEDLRRRDSVSSSANVAAPPPPMARPSSGKQPDLSQLSIPTDQAASSSKQHEAEENTAMPPPSAKSAEIAVDVITPHEAGDDLPVYSPRREESPSPIPGTSTEHHTQDYFSSQGSGSQTSPKISMPSPEIPSIPTADSLLPVPPPYVDTPSADSVPSSASEFDRSSNSDMLRSNSARSAASSHYTNAHRTNSLTASSIHSNGSSSAHSPRPLSTFTLDEDAPSPGPSNNQFIDQELLRGVSIGFQMPSVTDAMDPMSGAIPNVVSLPYGKCPPLHLKSPSWRQLLRLLARLSGSRLEPSVETHAVTKDTTYRLRTVIQFVKSHQMSQSWHTVLWFTIDHPVPPAMPGANKYTSNDVNVLPFSYTLSSIPALLRDADDSPISKTYTIPSTEKTPYPALPITFPNLALYLQAALDESRRYIDDSSSGFRKFGRIMQTCYPSTDAAQFPDPEGKRSVGGLFKRAFKGKQGDKKKNGRGGNEDTYEMITPFVPDEWGT